MRCPRCNRRIGFNQRGPTCPKCGAWLLTRPPSEHALEHMKAGPGKDDFLNQFPWIGGSPGTKAVKFTAAWVTALVLLVIGILVSLATMHFIIALVLIILTVILAVMPTLFLIGSRI